MYICELALQHFRCFDQFSLTVDQPVTIIAGANGSGKTALCEALYYGCYVRSFRTYVPRQLIQFGSDHCTLKIRFTDVSGFNDLHIGIGTQKRVIKLNERAVTSAKNLPRVFPVISISDLDIELITGGPERRRSFLDQYLLLRNADYADVLYKLQHIVANRNALLQSLQRQDEVFIQWTKLLWQQSVLIQEQRITALNDVMQETNQLLAAFSGTYSMNARYQACVELGTTFDDFLRRQPLLVVRERKLGRTLFGAHLDDVVFVFNDKPARLFASRGQQKLFCVLLKCSVASKLKQYRDAPILLFDDIMADFDEQRLSLVLSLLQNLNCQLFVTCAHHADALWEHFKDSGAQQLILP